MNPKFRSVYLVGGVIGLILLIYEVANTFPDIDPLHVLVITVPDLVFFFLAYKTYPAAVKVRKYRRSR